MGRYEEVLTVRDCAEWMGLSSDWIHRAIKTGVTAPSGRLVQLSAETVSLTGRRRVHRVYLHDFVTFLGAIGWSKIPHPRHEAPAPSKLHAVAQPKGA